MVYITLRLSHFTMFLQFILTSLGFLLYETQH